LFSSCSTCWHGHLLEIIFLSMCALLMIGKNELTI
jgi:hypothetical protein